MKWKNKQRNEIKNQTNEKLYSLITKQKDKKGIILPLALLILFLAGVTGFGIFQFMMDRNQTGETTHIIHLAKTESENALVYGVFASNVTAAEGGHKCESDWYTQDEREITNEDHGLTEIDGYKIRRFITFHGRTDNKDAKLTGIAKIYRGNEMVAEKRTEMRVNLLANGTSEGTTDLCKMTYIEMKKDTWQSL